MGLRIREHRKNRKLTGEDLADMVGVSKGYISELENGKKTPGASLLLRLSSALGVPMEDLFDVDDRERRIVSIFRSLTDVDADALLRVAEALEVKQQASQQGE